MFRRYSDANHWTIEILLTPWRKVAYSIEWDDMHPLRRWFFITWKRKPMHMIWWGQEIRIRFGICYA